MYILLANVSPLHPQRFGGCQDSRAFSSSCPSSQVQPAQMSIPPLPLWPAALVLIVWDGGPAQVSLKLFRGSSIVKIWGSSQNPENY